MGWSKRNLITGVRWEYAHLSLGAAQRFGEMGFFEMTFFFYLFLILCQASRIDSWFAQQKNNAKCWHALAFYNLLDYSRPSSMPSDDAISCSSNRYDTTTFDTWHLRAVGLLILSSNPC